MPRQTSSKSPVIEPVIEVEERDVQMAKRSLWFLFCCSLPGAALLFCLIVLLPDMGRRLGMKPGRMDEPDLGQDHVPSLPQRSIAATASAGLTVG
jgi:hypothetical protein